MYFRMEDFEKDADKYRRELVQVLEALDWTDAFHTTGSLKNHPAMNRAANEVCLEKLKRISESIKTLKKALDKYWDKVDVIPRGLVNLRLRLSSHTQAIAASTPTK